MRLLSLVVPALLAFAACLPLSAAPLPAETVETKLRGIPVFVVTDQEGAPLVAKGSYGAFLDPREADAFMAQLRTGKPELAAESEVRAIPLSEIVKRSIQPGTALMPDFIAAKADRAAARELLAEAFKKAREKDPDAKPPEALGNAPVFVVRSGADYLTVAVDERTLVPVFFTKAQADEVVTKYATQPGRPAPHVEVVALEVVLTALVSGEDEDLGRLSLVPSPAMMAAVAPKEPAPAPSPGP